MISRTTERTRTSRQSEGEGADRSYVLPFQEPALIASAAALNPKTIVILNAGGSVETKAWIANVPVLLDAFYPGQEGGTAIAEILFGQTNPSGKLPFCWEKQWEDSAAFGNYPTAQNPGANTYKEGVFLGYRWFDARGSSRCFHSDSDLVTLLSRCRMPVVANDASGNLEVTATIRNTGSRAGADVVQVYVEPPKAGVPRPVRELKAFLKVALEPGESKTVTMPISRADLAYWDPGRRPGSLPRAPTSQRWEIHREIFPCQQASPSRSEAVSDLGQPGRGRNWEARFFCHRERRFERQLDFPRGFLTAVAMRGDRRPLDDTGDIALVSGNGRILN